MNTRRMRTLNVLVVLAMLFLVALPTAAAPPAPLAAAPLSPSAPTADFRPAAPANLGNKRVAAPLTLQAAASEAVTATWNSLDPVLAAADADAVSFVLSSEADLSPFVVAAYGLAHAVVQPGGPLAQDPDQDWRTDFLGAGQQLWPFTITSADLLRVFQTRNFEGADLDLQLFFDANSDGQFLPSDRIAFSELFHADDEIIMALPEPGNYLLVAHAWEGDGRYDLLSYAVTQADLSASLAVSGAPPAISDGGQYTMQLAWNDQIDQGRQYFGLVTLGNGADPLALGYEVLRLVGDVPIVQKTASRQIAEIGDTVDYTIVISNAADEERNIALADAIPDSLAVDPTSLTGDAMLSDGQIVWNGALPALGAGVDVAPAVFPLGGYISLAGLGLAPLPTPDPFLPGDEDQIVFENLPAVGYLGNMYDTVCMVSNGYLVMGGCRPPYQDISWNGQLMPNLRAPNNVLAPLWMDLDLASDDGAGAGHWYGGVVTSGSDQWLAFEWENAQRYIEPDTAFTFQVWLKVGADEVYFVYHRLDGPFDGSAVGAETRNGAVGDTVFYLDWNGNQVGEPPTTDSVFQVTGQDPDRPSHTVTYRAQATSIGQAINTAEVLSGPARDSASATVTVGEPEVMRSRRYNVSMDTFLDATQPGVNFGAASTMWVGYEDQMRPVVWADIPVCDDKLTCIPSGSTVDKAYLYLYVTEGRGFADWAQSRIADVSARPVLLPWAEDSATWTAPWHTTGGNLGPALSSTHLGVGKVGTWLRFDVTAHVAAIVAGQAANYGFALTSSDPNWTAKDAGAIRGVRYGLASQSYWDPSKAGYLRVMYRTFTAQQ